MGSIPLPALAARAPEQPDPLAQVSKVVALKNLLQQSQYQQQLQPLELQQHQAQAQITQQQIADQQAGMQALHEWDGKDYDQLGKLIGKNGGSLNAVNQAQQAGLAIREKYSTIAKNDSETGAKQIDTLKEKNHMLGGRLAALNDVPDGDLSQAILSSAQDALQSGLIDQQHMQSVTALANMNPQQARRSLAFMEKSLKGDTQQLEDAQKLASTQKTQAEIPGAQAESTQKQAGLQAMQSWLTAHPGKTAADYEVSQAGRKAGAEAGARLGSEMSLEKYKTNLQRGMLPQELQGVAPQLVPAAASQYEKASTEYAGARAAQEEMKSLIDLARGGNKIAYAYSPTTGVLTINSANGVKRVNMAEIGSYSGAGSAVDRITGWLGKQVSGASIPSDILNDMQQVHENLGRTATQKYANQVQATNSTYGSKFKPQDFSKQSGPVTVTDPAGGTHTFPDQQSADKFKAAAGIQ